MTAQTFSLALSEFVEKAKGNAEQIVREVATQMLTKVVDRSPVGNPDIWLSLNPVTDVETEKTTIQRKAPAGYVGGRFRGNWQVSFDTALTEEIDRIDASGASAKQAGLAVIAAYKAGIGSIWMMNNVPYAQRLEYGWSHQAPQGMVRVTVEEFDTFVRKAVEELPD